MKRLAPLAFVVFAGCGADSDLDGSLSEIYRLDHDTVRARLYATELAIEYVAGDDSVPVRVSLRFEELPREGDYDLLETGDVGGRRADGTEMPRFSSGTISIDSFEPYDDGDISGDFTARFKTGGDTLDLTGSFDTSLELVDWPPR